MNGSSSFQDRKEKPVEEDPIDSQLPDTGKPRDLPAMFTRPAKTVELSAEREQWFTMKEELPMEEKLNGR